MHASESETPIYRGDDKWGGGFVTGSQNKITISQPRVSSKNTKQNPIVRILTLKDSIRSTLASLTNESHQVYLKAWEDSFF